MSLSSKAIVLSTECFGEADRYIQFFTQRWGVISTLAKSARKSKRRYVGGLDLFCHDEIFLRGEPKERPYLVELTVLNSFTGIREQLEKMLAAGKCTQWIRKLCESAGPMPEVYSLLGQTLALIEKEPDPIRLELLVLIFRMKLLTHIGLKPRVEACVRCTDSESTNVIFSNEAGGVVCEKCLRGHSLRDYIYLSHEERQFLDVADQFRLTSFSQIQFAQDKVAVLGRLVTQFASYHTHVRLPA